MPSLVPSTHPCRFQDPCPEADVDQISYLLAHDPSGTLSREFSAFLRQIVEEAIGEEYAFNNALHRGSQLAAGLHTSDKLSSRCFQNRSSIYESKFSNPGALPRWGYATESHDDYYDFEMSLPIRNALRGIGVSEEHINKGGPNRAFLCAHERWTEHEGVEYPPTQASFYTIFNIIDGVMIAWGAFSPTHQGLQQYPPIYTTPELRQWSDITYLQWAALHSSPYSPPISHLRYIIVPAIFNPESQQIISYALQKARKTLRKWPGVHFGMDSVEGRAILGCPNGYGIAYLLLQHRKQLGRKRVKTVTVFEDDGAKPVPRPPSLVFWIEDLQDDRGGYSEPCVINRDASEGCWRSK